MVKKSKKEKHCISKKLSEGTSIIKIVSGAPQYHETNIVKPSQICFIFFLSTKQTF